MSEYRDIIEKLNLGKLGALRPFCAVNEAYAEEMVEYAQPHALSVLGWRAPPSEELDGVLPVVAEVVSANDGIFGQLMPAWPMTGQRPVTIYVLDNWGFYLYLLRNTVSEPEEATRIVDQLFCDSSRIQVGITNDVIQAFVNHPPAPSYSFVRHHALMLFLGILWLPERQQRGWLEIMNWCSRTLCREYRLHEMADPLKWIDTIALTGNRILEEYGPSTRTDEGVAALLNNKAVLAEFFPYLGATSLAIASLGYQYSLCPKAEHEMWQTQAANIWHAEPDFNTDWILDYLETLRW